MNFSFESFIPETLAKFLIRTDNFCNRLEKQLGLYPAAFILAFLIMMIASIYVTPSMSVQELGRGYKQLSVDPFDFSQKNELCNRLLTPLLAYSFFLRDEYYIFFPQIMTLILLSATYIHYRKNGSCATESLGMVSLLAFSSTILFTLHFQGYVDTTSYLLIFLCYIFIDKLFLWLFLLSLALLNHESNFFAIPWLICLYHMRNKNSNYVYTFAFLCISVAPLLFWRWFVSLHFEESLNFQYYLNYKYVIDNFYTMIIYSHLGIFETFKLFWLIPVIAIVLLIKKKHYNDALLMIIIIISGIALLMLSSDTSRIIALCFPAILLGAERLKEAFPKEYFNKFLWMIIILNFFIPQCYVGQDNVIPLIPLPLTLFLAWKGFFTGN